MNMQLVKEITATQIRHDLPAMQIGDTVIVGVNIIEGNKTRVQDYQGIVIRQRGEGVSKSVTVRKISSGVGVERVFQVNSPIIAYVKIVSHGKVRRAKLYYLRSRKGKASKVARKI